MSSARGPKSILVLDDDPAFRALVKQILTYTGFAIVEARSARDGLYAAQMNDLILSIVDYRLPESDGITFISQLRAMGNSAPVVFVSGSWCDAKMFNMLRNILHVSLVLQKPIEPMLFKQQMEGLLPTQRPAATLAKADPRNSYVNLTKQEYNKLLLSQTGRRVALVESGPNDAIELEMGEPAQMQGGDFCGDAETASASTEAGRMDTSMPLGMLTHSHSEDGIPSQPGANAFVMHGPAQTFSPYRQDDTAVYRPIVDDPRARAEELKKVELVNKVREAQAQLRKSIPPEWETLSIMVARVQADPLDGRNRSEALSQAHKLRGTAGSLGLEQTGMCAGRIEDYLTMLDPTDSTEHEILWSEIFRSLADGQVGLGQCEAESEPTKRIYNIGKVLVFAAEATVESSINSIEPQILATFIRCDRPIDIAMKASSERFQAAIIDTSVGGKRQAFSIARQIRSSGGNENLPLIFILPQGETLSPAELTYSGALATLSSPLAPGALDQALKQIASESSQGQPLIMTVDDDPVLTSFIASVLGERGMRVSGLNEPIHILEELDKVEPDLVLLDVIMPGLSGYDVCRMLRANPRWQSLPIVFLTSKSDIEGRTSAFKAGGDDFLSKPVLSDELVARIQAQLDRSASERRKHTLDELTGAMKTEIFLKRCQTALAQAKDTGGKLSLCLITINDYDKLERYGTFTGYQVITALSNLLKVRYRGDVLRGRLGEGGFALCIANDERDAVAESLLHLEAEFKLCSFNSEDGQRFEVSLSTSSSTYPSECQTFEEMLEHSVKAIDAKVRVATGEEFKL